MTRILSTVVVSAVALLLSCNQPPKEAQETPRVVAPAATVPTVSVPASPWSVSSSRDELTGQVKVTAIDGFRDTAIIIRLVGKKLDCFVTTGDFLETLDNMDSRRSVVKYKFDQGEITRQAWIISDDNTALFYPGNPRAFIQKLRNAKKFVIQYSPAEKIAHTEAFDVYPFPKDLIDSLGLK